MSAPSDYHAHCPCVERRHTAAASGPRRGALLLNLGTPDEPTTAAVRRYLVEFLADPEVIQLPNGFGWFNKPLARLIAQFRAPKSAEAYATIWTERGSPLKVITEDQVDALQQVLPKGWSVFYAMRYGEPSIRRVLDDIEASDLEELIVIPMYPQFAGPTTRTAMTEFYMELRDRSLSANIRVYNAWYDDAGYVDAQAQLVYDYAQKHALTPDDTFLLFSTHSMPESYIQKGDPYQEQVLRSYELVMKRLGWPEDRAGIAYQSKLGPAKWLSPSTAEMVDRLAEQGETQLLVCPISFTADCLETIEEIGEQYAEQFEAHGGHLFLCPSLNCYQPFIKSLSQLVLRGPKPLGNREQEPLMSGFARRDELESRIDDLVMIGVSLPGRIGPGLGPKVNHVEDPNAFKQVRTSQNDAPQLLREVRESAGFRECWLWNTCHRGELYGWFEGEAAYNGAFEQHVEKAASRLFGGERNGLSVNVLRGRDAWRHLVRTAAGLNSHLPGEIDVLDQLDSAHRMAAHAETTGALTDRLLEDITDLLHRLRNETPWGEFCVSYGALSLERLRDTTPKPFDECQWVLVGGSTTSRGLLGALRQQFNVQEKQLTLIHRGASKGTQLKMLRKAVGRGRRVRVNEYTDPDVRKTLLEADVILLGIDRREPVVKAEYLRDSERDFNERPLTIIDFNTHGSIEDDVASIGGVRVLNAADVERELTCYADELLTSERFAEALESAEAWIEKNTSGYDAAPLGNGRSAKANGDASCHSHYQDRDFCLAGSTPGGALNERHH